MPSRKVWWDGAWVDIGGGGGGGFPTVTRTRLSSPADAGMSLPDPGANHTLGSWQQVIASTAETYDGLLVTCTYWGANGIGLVDIGVGGSGAEVPIASNLLVGRTGNGLAPAEFYIPIAVPSGSRIVARFRGNGASREMHVYVQGLTGIQSGSSFQTYGVTPGSTTGTTVTPGSGSKGSWTEIAASTGHDLVGVIAAMTVLTGGTGQQTNEYLMDIGVGGAGAETPVISDQYFTVHSSSDNFSPGAVGPLWQPIPSGSRLSARMSQDTGSAAAQQVALYGIVA